MILAVIIIAILALTAITIISYNSFLKGPHHKISFKETLALTNLPIITFEHNWGKTGNYYMKLNFILDTGSTKSIIDSSILSSLKYKDTDSQFSIHGIEGKSIVAESAVIKLKYDDAIFEEEFQKIDMHKAFNSIKEGTGATIHGILGNSFFEKYKYVIDFNKLVAYENL